MQTGDIGYRYNHQTAWHTEFITTETQCLMQYIFPVKNLLPYSIIFLLTIDI